MNDTNLNLRDIKPPIEIPSGYQWLWWALGALLLLLIIAWAWRAWRRRRLHVPPPVVVPPHVRARQKLQQALAVIHDPREFCILVSDAIRWYLEERFNFRAPERTTEEFLHDLQQTDLLSPQQKESLTGFLQRCDLVKFARYTPGESELRNLYDAAVRLVDETEPRLTAVQPAGQEPQSPVAS